MGLEQSMSHFPREECVSASALRACNSGGALRAHQQRATRAIPPARYARIEQPLSAAGLLPAGMPRGCKGARLKQAKLLPGLSVSESRRK